jgi:putative PIN family toxin of toxin-antitoxin system
VRAVLDPNVLIAALLSPGGTPARLLSRWIAGDFELVISEPLLEELRRALRYPKLRRHIDAADADEYVAFLASAAVMIEQPTAGAHRSSDPGDDYLLALAENADALLVTGDKHLLQLAGELPIQTPAAFIAGLESG